MFDDIKPHIKELRKRLGYSVLAIFIAFIGSFFYWELILGWMIDPLQATLPPGSSVIFTKVGEAFFVALKVAFFAGFIIALPVVFWQMWLFIAPGLYENEKLLVIPFVVFGTGMFLLGSLFAYYVVFPFGFGYLISFGSQLFTALPSISEYVGFFTKLMIGFGISFELPVITFFLAKLGLINDETLKKHFKFAVVIIFIAAAVLTPPDVISQVLMAIPLVLLYGLSILIAKAVNPAVPEEKEADEKAAE